MRPRAHADAIFIGPGEDTWPRFLRDFRAGAGRALRFAARAPWRALPPIRRDLIQRQLYLVPNSIVVSRGCPHVCDFCYKEAFFEGGRSFYTQTVDEPWPKSSGCRGAISTSWTTTCSATAASRPRSSMACGAWAGCGRRRAR